MPSSLPNAAWMRSMIAPSWFDWKKDSSAPRPGAISDSRASMSASVARPYTPGSRTPSIFKFGPLMTAILSTGHLRISRRQRRFSENGLLSTHPFYHRPPRLRMTRFPRGSSHARFPYALVGTLHRDRRADDH